MPRVLWKGAISFGLVHIPVGLYPASREDDIDFDWLDKRTMDPVGYKRINKRTGKEIDKSNIVKGVKYDDGQYVLLSDEEIKEAYPKTTQMIEIEAFVQAQEIPFVYLERPYYLAPLGKGDKVYALLRETLVATGRIGIARVVIQTKEHLAALIPSGPALMLNTLRWASEIRPLDEIKLPAEGKNGPSLSEKEIKMASQLVEDMSAEWDPEQYGDKFREAVMALVEQKAEAGEVSNVTPLEDAPSDSTASNVIDLSELLKRSLNRGGGKGEAEAPPKASGKRAGSPASASPRQPADKDSEGSRGGTAARKASGKTATRTAVKTAAKTAARTTARKTAASAPAARKRA
ncbi:MAG: Ku protein [Rubrivivax sp.]|nr:MAG: Ku protein [Rubrivivax sp.]